MYDENDNLNTLDDAPPPEESGNKTFLLVAAVLGGFVLLSIVCLAAYGLYFLPRQTAARNASQSTLVAQNLQVNQALTAKALTNLPQSTATLEPTNTPVFQQSTGTLAPADPQTATVAAALTQAAQAQLTVTSLPTSTLLPDTGFIDDVGAPGLAVMAMALVVVILLARRLRAAPAK
ncbi:MAG: hypothetical protein COS37_03295 [Anaerolineae bacterium CG03_land_8_20_14_0_80_58_20]|nr:MAG: hypothetical protein COS37_03295 [Anaerolineae bacterium CG03_land_8_20_14_0_80_58_20]